MKRKLRTAAMLALAFGLTACNEPAPAGDRASASPSAPPAPPRASEAAKTSPQAQLSADLELSSKVKAAVEEPARSHIEVAANEGVVTLYGTVDRPSDKQRIALAALGVEGVRSVVNNLVVLSGS